MKNKFMIGLWRFMINAPQFLWEKEVVKAKRRFELELGFMSEAHRLAHHFVVKELPYAGEPLSPEFIADKLSLPIPLVNAILDDLEKHMTFLFRNLQGSVVWAYPVTVDRTPHKVTFDTGEELYAAGAADAFATPFVQGQLRDTHLCVTIRTECAHCSRPMELQIDSDLQVTVNEEGCNPIVFVPDVDLFKIKDESIINAFGNESVFFWSEEHANEDRKKGLRTRGAYFGSTLMAKGTRILQSAIFGFGRRTGETSPIQADRRPKRPALYTDWRPSSDCGTGHP